MFTSLMSGHVGAPLAELLELFCKARTFELNGRSDDGDEVVMGHLVRGKAYYFEIGGQKTSFFLKAYQVCYSLGIRVRSYEAKECWKLSENV